MVFLARLASCFLVAAPIAASAQCAAPIDGTSLIMRAAIRSRSHLRELAGLRYSANDPASQTLQTLDTNHDGRIDAAEIKAFALAQGLDAAASTEEFSSIDLNGDGVLDSAELASILGSSANLEEMPTKVESVAPLANGNTVEELVAPVANPQKVAADATTQPASPVDSMTKLTAATDTIMPLIPSDGQAQEEAQFVEAPAVAPSTEFISQESKRSLQTAAEDLSEQLKLEESEEKASRDLYQKAAETRSESNALVKRTMQTAVDAGVSAAHEKADDLLDKLTQLEEQAQKAEVRSAALRAKSRMEAEQASDLMAAAEEALK